MPAGPVPTIDIRALRDPRADDRARSGVAREIYDACTEFGFLQVVGHGIDPALRGELADAAAAFFALDENEKDRIAMRHGGRAWRGWFPVGAELTAGTPDDKEGLYFGTELASSDPRVLAGRPLHGPNQFPERPVALRGLVLRWMDEVTAVGQAILSGIAISFGLAPDHFDRWCADPTILFRIFHYPPPPPDFPGRWGVAEHTDYGLLTLLVTDDTGGLEVRVGDDWTEVDLEADGILCNLGDTLERITGGRFRSTPHRVRLPERDRYSFPLFLDPGWDSVPVALPGCEPDTTTLGDAATGRWDGRSVFDSTGTYGEFLLEKVARVFPELFDEVVRYQPPPG